MGKNKNTKMFLAGTLVLSSVVAVALPTDPAEAADPKEAAAVVVKGSVVSTTSANVKTDPQSVVTAINSAPTVTQLAISATDGVQVDLPFSVIQALQSKDPEAIINVLTSAGSIEVEAQTFNGPAAAKELEVGASKLVVSIGVAKGPQRLNDSKVAKLPFVVGYSVDISAGGERVLPYAHFFEPLKRTIQTPTAMNTATTVGIRFNEDGSLRAVPTYVEDNDTVNLHFATNSEYAPFTLIQHEKTFKDIDGRGFWAEDAIEKLASRMITSGKTDTVYAPDQAVTRGEFAALLARGLGLVPVEGHRDLFTDVSQNQSVNKNGEITAVAETGIVQGYGNKKFKPDAPISREEAAIMIGRALEFIDADSVKLDTSKGVANFKDYKYISKSARPYVETALQAGFLTGFDDNTFRGANKTTRAETAKILYNFLNTIKYIN